MKLEFYAWTDTHMGSGTIGRIKLEGLSWDHTLLRDGYFFPDTDIIKDDDKLYIAEWPGGLRPSFIVYLVDAKNKKFWHSKLTDGCPESLEVIAPHKVKVKYFRIEDGILEEEIDASEPGLHPKSHWGLPLDFCDKVK